MAEWSELPSDVLELIARQLGTHSDVLQLHAVCFSWRSALSKRPYRLPCRVPLLPNEGSDYNFRFNLLKRTIYCLLPASRLWTSSDSNQASSDGWLIKLEEDVPGMMRLLYPLTKDQIHPLPSMFPKVMDLSDLQISELGHEYLLQCVKQNFNPFIDPVKNLYMKNVAFFSAKPIISSPADINDVFTLLRIHVSGKLAMFKSGDKKWTILEKLGPDYSDVICFKGKFYAVNATGRTAIFDRSATLSSTVFIKPFAIFPVISGSKMYLVESEGDLILVDRYDLNGKHCFKVFKFYEGRQEWDELQSLDGRLLFLGDGCSFSASASDFPGCKGKNLCFFTEEFPFGEGGYRFKGMQVFNLDDGCTGPLASYPGYSKVFWPPPSWVASTSVGISAQVPLSSTLVK
ncbi:hypothetical protein NE237_022092 [Protea cynaroides]|uniref:KIB1-4 beta-propeller domain-containing protein n=1 Tax=Protea cynaroides TaxID=273540 RepID=A0A9Q0HCF5_9MAGN|nr:hypothetical protein NE237_022092 [Protea cynaroides]